uniref:Uncharacterized protein n=1 Tax=Aegilops tauschii subsp. strangulata TaxID=200361 RepID=A0A453DWG9_AEGTS
IFVAITPILILWSTLWQYLMELCRSSWLDTIFNRRVAVDHVFVLCSMGMWYVVLISCKIPVQMSEFLEQRYMKLSGA